MSSALGRRGRGNKEKRTTIEEGASFVAEQTYYKAVMDSNAPAFRRQAGQPLLKVVYTQPIDGGVLHLALSAEVANHNKNYQWCLVSSQKSSGDLGRPTVWDETDTIGKAVKMFNDFVEGHSVQTADNDRLSQRALHDAIARQTQ